MAARAAARLGREVWHAGLVNDRAEKYGVYWIPITDLRPSLLQGSLVWLTCYPHVIQAKKHGARIVLLWQHWDDYNYCPPGWKSFIDVHGVSTKTHEQHCRRVGELMTERFIVSAFGVEREWLSPLPWQERAPSILYGSSPDRGLHYLLGMYPALHAATGATLTIAYNMEEWLAKALSDPRRSDFEQAKTVGYQLKDLLMAGFPITLTGHVNHRKFLTLLGQSRVLAYPCDVPESFGLVVAEAIASGCRVVTTNTGSFPEQYGKRLPLVDISKPEWQMEFQESVINALQSDGPPEPFPLRTWDDHTRDVLEALNI
jgi:glycosyltransferase involved in cell wall biosynthesis